MTKRQDRRVRFKRLTAENAAKLGAKISAQSLRESEWRVALGQSPNPWHGDKSADEHRAGPQVMQIVTRTRLSKLQLRSLMETSPPE